MVQDQKQTELDTVRRRLARVPPAERVLLLSHCQKPSQTCPGKFSPDGLVCPPGCAVACNLHTLWQAAVEMGYKGVCIAAGGAQAVQFIKKHGPHGIVAIACHKELDEGIAAVREMGRENAGSVPPVVTVPLEKDGCVDTTVDMTLALAAIRLGAVPAKPRSPGRKLRRQT